MISVEQGLQNEYTKFLEQLRPGGPWVLTAIIPDGPTTTITAHNAAEVDAFIRQYNSVQNLYYTLNPTKADMSKKPDKSDIASAQFVHADLDPNDDETPEAAQARYLSKLETFQPKPTAIINSGNGIQALWKLHGALGPERFAEVEACSKVIMLALGSKAGTQNIDRLLRIPGTINLPNAKKRKNGRVQCETKLIQFNGASYLLDVFPKPRQEQRQERRGRKRELPQQLRLMLHMQGDQPAGYPSRSELFYAFINAALRTGIADDHIVDLCLDQTYAGYSIFEHVKHNGGETYTKKQIERIINEPAKPKGEKQILRLKDGQLDQHWRAVEDALIKAECQVYVRAGGVLVQPLYEWEDAGDNERQILSCKLVKYNLPQLSDMVQHHAVTCQKFDMTQNIWRNTDPPKKLIERLLEMGHYKLPRVAGIITAPTMRPNGTLITEPGYDAETKLWYKPAGGVELPNIPEQPSEAEAKDALKLLKDLVKECAFADQKDKSVDRSVVLAAMMTVVLRGAFRIAPVFFIHKPEPGTGGSYLVKIIATLALGREAVPFNVSSDPKELVKELSAAAYEAKPIINLNNLTFDLESSLLSQMSTEAKISIRPFGKNTETVECDCSATTVIANGNNVHPVGELVRRTMSCRLDAKMERPETREFKHDPIAMIKSDRGKYLAAVFTIVRAYMNMNPQDKPDVIRINGFEDWSKFVQQPLVWLGEADPVDSQKDARDRDPDRVALKERFAALAKYIGADKKFDAAEVLRLGTDFDGRGHCKHPGLNEAFNCNKGTKSIGWQLSKDLDRQSGNYRLELADTGRTGNTYRLHLVQQEPASEPVTEVVQEEPVTEVVQEEEVPF